MAVCSNCKKEVLLTDRFCKECGNPVNVQMNHFPNVNTQSSSMQLKRNFKWIWIAGGVAVVFVVLVLYFGSPNREIDSVKEATLSAYDYGKTIGVALDNWFGGTVEWYTMEEDGKLYVCARGECRYMVDSFEPTQIFLFRIPESSDYFYFEGAYDENGYPIFSHTENMADNWSMEIYDSFLGVNLHDYAIRAAFGDEETLRVLAE